jgi:hypothetical protein
MARICGQAEQMKIGLWQETGTTEESCRRMRLILQNLVLRGGYRSNDVPGQCDLDVKRIILVGLPAMFCPSVSL